LIFKSFLLGKEGDLSPSLQESTNEGQATPTAVESEEDDDDDDEAALLREILLKSVAKKRAAKTTDLKVSIKYTNSWFSLIPKGIK
jgi:hypothetical protein